MHTTSDHTIKKKLCANNSMQATVKENMCQ